MNNLATSGEQRRVYNGWGDEMISGRCVAVTVEDSFPLHLVFFHPPNLFSTPPDSHSHLSVTPILSETVEWEKQLLPSSSQAALQCWAPLAPTPPYSLSIHCKNLTSLQYSHLTSKPFCLIFLFSYVFSLNNQELLKWHCIASIYNQLCKSYIDLKPITSHCFQLSFYLLHLLFNSECWNTLHYVCYTEGNALLFFLFFITTNKALDTKKG